MNFNRLSESNAIKFLIKLFKPYRTENSRDVKPGNNETWNDFVSNHEDEYFWPEGLSESTLLLDRIPVPASILDLSHKSWLVNIASELMISDRCYFTIADNMLSGPDSLFLCAAGIYDKADESKDDLSAVITGWVGYGWAKDIPYPPMISNSCILKDGKIFSVIALQLSSYKRFIKNDRDS